jgi:hypothetical protein
MTDHDRIKTALESIGFRVHSATKECTYMLEDDKIGCAVSVWSDGGINMTAEGDTAVSFLIALGSALDQKGK